MSIARWGEGCRCHYIIARASRSLQENGDVIGGGRANDIPNSAGTIENTAGQVGGDNSGGGQNCAKKEDPDWLAFYLRRAGHRGVRPSPLDLLQVRSPPAPTPARLFLATAVYSSRTRVV